MIVVCSLYIFV